MKKIKIVLVFFLMGHFTFSQIEKGTVLLNGGSALNFSQEQFTGADPSSYFDPDFKSSQRTMNANFLTGYFVIKGLLVGAQFNFEHTSQIDEYIPDNEAFGISINTLSVAPTIRYYIGDIGIWSQASYGFGNQTVKFISNDTNEPDKAGIGDLGLEVGYAIFLGDKVSLNPSVGYSMKRIKSEVTDFSTGETENVIATMTEFNFNVGIALHL